MPLFKGITKEFMLSIRGSGPWNFNGWRRIFNGPNEVLGSHRKNCEYEYDPSGMFIETCLSLVFSGLISISA